MNNYNNKIGYYTPKESEIYHSEIVEGTGLSWVCSSWHNDATDSIHYEGITIYFPNSKEDNPDEEEFNTFNITNDDGEDLLTTGNIKEVISFLNKY